MPETDTIIMSEEESENTISTETLMKEMEETSGRGKEAKHD